MPGGDVTNLAATYTSFAVVGGTGNVGKQIVDALSKSTPQARVLVLTRSTPTAPSTTASNVTIATVDYDDPSSLVSLFEKNGVEVMIDTSNPMPPGPTVLQFHKKVADIAKKASSVRLFVPSEFGVVTEGVKEGLLKYKADVQAYAKEIGLDYVLVMNGIFTDWIPRLLGTASGKLNIIGKGDTPASFTSIQDVANFLSHILTTLPPQSLANSSHRIEGDRLTLNHLSTKFKITPEYHEGKLPGEGPMVMFATFLLSAIERGECSSGWDWDEGTDDKGRARSGNGLLGGGYVWKKVEDVRGL